MIAPSNPDDSILCRLIKYTQQNPEKIIYRFLRETGGLDTRTFGQLEQRVRGLAASLREHAAPGDRALLEPWSN
jgi:acyl-CoA synthetase (AMP-forming)/AMP-acid ligase II